MSWNEKKVIECSGSDGDHLHSHNNKEFLDTLTEANTTTPYGAWLAVGNEGTEQDFLDSMKGQDGNSLIFEELTEVQKEELKGDDNYQLWLDAGNIGTLEEYLLSLNGADGTVTFDELTEAQKAELKGVDGTVTFDELTEAQKEEITGKSAYLLWLDAGNIGTLEEYLLSLNGVDGTVAFDELTEAQKAELKGVDGTVIFEDLTPIQVDEITGKSAYQIWLDSGHIGTEEEFLNSLKSRSDIIPKTTTLTEDLIVPNDSILTLEEALDMNGYDVILGTNSDIRYYKG